MFQDSTTTSSGSINQIWPESYIATAEVESFSRPAAPTLLDSAANAGFILAIILFFLVAYSRILEGFYYILSSFWSLKKILVIESQSNPQTSRNTLLLFSIIVSSFILASSNHENRFADNSYPIIVNFAIILSCIGVYLLFRRCAFYLLSWVNYNGIFNTIHKISYSYLVLGMLFSLIGFLFSIFFDSLDYIYSASYITASMFLAFLFYFIRGYQLIIANGFSHFFYILYLCTLEILPLIILAHLIFT
ncbi:MAG: DUF4271 domain-containing protein [Bacteroidales bacterium]